MLQTLTYTLALNWALRPIVKWKLSFLSFRGGRKSSARGAQTGERGGGWEGGDQAADVCLGLHHLLLLSPQDSLRPADLLPHYPDFCTSASSSCRSSLPTCWPDRGLQMSAWNLILISWLRSSGVQGRKNVYILIYCSYLICNLKWNQGNPVGSQAVLREESIIFYRRHLYHPIPQASLKKKTRGEKIRHRLYYPQARFEKRRQKKNRSPPSSGQVCHPTIKANTNVTI